MRILAIVVLSCLLGAVYWLGATVYSERIERDIAERTQQTIDTHNVEIADISRRVDGRDVELFGTATTDSFRDAAGADVKDVWGVRAANNHIVTAASTLENELTDQDQFNFYADYQHPELVMSGIVDEGAHDTAMNIHQALPPATVLDTTGLKSGPSTLPRSRRKLETGIAALTQLNPGTLRISDHQFILEGDVASPDRKKTIEQLIDTRREDLDPLEVILDIRVVHSVVPENCQQQLDQVLADNVINYAVDHYQILNEHKPLLDKVANAVLGPCAGHINAVLVESHADFTGSDGYNQGLSERRASTARDYLLANGLDHEIVQDFGYGEFRPIASNDTSAGRAKNRRTEIYVITPGTRQDVESPSQISTWSDE